MIRKLFVALSAAVFTIAIVITILGHCGSTWVALAPTFGPQLTRSDCTTGGGSTRTTKSVETFPTPGLLVVPDIASMGHSYRVKRLT